MAFAGSRFCLFVAHRSWPVVLPEGSLEVDHVLEYPMFSEFWNHYVSGNDPAILFANWIVKAALTLVGLLHLMSETCPTTHSFRISLQKSDL